MSYESLDTKTLADWWFIIGTQHNIEEKVIQSIYMEQLFQCVTSLSEDEEKLFCLHYLDNVSEVQLASMYGITQQAISKKLKKIISKLKKQLRL